MRPMVIRLAFLVTAAAARLPAQWPVTQLKNVKSLPADIRISALIDTMKYFTRALGVRCTYCHVGREDQSLDQYDFASDDRPAKEKARVMIRMVSAINAQYLASLPTRRDPAIVVSCATCHRGLTQPRPIQQVILTAYKGGGIGAADSTYRALRARYFGSGSYDFGDGPLTEVAAAVQRQGQAADAIRLYQLNIELFPASDLAYRQLGFAYLSMSDTAAALATFRKRLELQPDNPEAKQLVALLTKKPPSR
jgi:tetratricopeptide (TPR) repeat protein